MVSTSGLAIVLVFVVGVSIGLVFIKDRRSQMEQQMRVPMPKFGGLDTRHKGTLAGMFGNEWRGLCPTHCIL